VVDKKGGVLQGASIELQPLGATTVTDTKGEFKLVGVPAGAQKVIVSFIGFNLGTADVTVAAGQTVRTEVSLDVATKNEEVLVTAERPHGEADALNRERTAGTRNWRLCSRRRPKRWK